MCPVDVQFILLHLCADTRKAAQPFVDLELCAVGQGAKKVVELRDWKEGGAAAGPSFSLAKFWIALIGASAFTSFLNQTP